MTRYSSLTHPVCPNLILPTLTIIPTLWFLGMHDAYDAVFHGGIGFVATVFAVLVTYPLQTLRTRMQVRHTPQRPSTRPSFP